MAQHTSNMYNVEHIERKRRTIKVAAQSEEQAKQLAWEHRKEMEIEEVTHTWNASPVQVGPPTINRIFSFNLALDRIEAFRRLIKRYCGPATIIPRTIELEGDTLTADARFGSFPLKFIANFIPGTDEFASKGCCYDWGFYDLDGEPFELTKEEDLEASLFKAHGRPVDKAWTPRRQAMLDQKRRVVVQKIAKEYEGTGRIAHIVPGRPITSRIISQVAAHREVPLKAIFEFKPWSTELKTWGFETLEGQKYDPDQEEAIAAACEFQEKCEAKMWEFAEKDVTLAGKLSPFIQAKVEEERNVLLTINRADAANARLQSYFQAYSQATRPKVYSSWHVDQDSWSCTLKWPSGKVAAFDVNFGKGTAEITGIQLGGVPRRSGCGPMTEEQKEEILSCHDITPDKMNRILSDARTDVAEKCFNLFDFEGHQTQSAGVWEENGDSKSLEFTFTYSPRIYRYTVTFKPWTDEPTHQKYEPID